MAIVLAGGYQNQRIASLENEVDRLAGRKPRNRYECTACGTEGRVNLSYHGSPEYVKCDECQGGELVKKANEELFK